MCYRNAGDVQLLTHEALPAHKEFWPTGVFPPAGNNRCDG